MIIGDYHLPTIRALEFYLAHLCGTYPSRMVWQQDRPPTPDDVVAGFIQGYQQAIEDLRTSVVPDDISELDS